MWGKKRKSARYTVDMLNMDSRSIAEVVAASDRVIAAAEETAATYKEFAAKLEALSEVIAANNRPKPTPRGVQNG